MEVNNKILEWIGGVLAAIGISWGTFRLTKKKYVADTDLSKAQTNKINTEERHLIMQELKELRKELNETLEKNLQLEQELLIERNKCNTLMRRITVLETFPFKK